MIDIRNASALGLCHLTSTWPQPKLTVVAKAVLRLEPDGICTLVEEPVAFRADEPLDGAEPLLVYASDLVPLKPVADVMVHGEGDPKGAARDHRIGIGALRFEARTTGGAVQAFAPRAITHPDRQQRLGTYDARWVEERWPYHAADFDPRYFNAAAPALQLDGFLQGDEALTFEHLDPTAPLVRTRLPGLRPRCLLVTGDGDSEQTSELPLNLDTLWVDVVARQIVLVWRGITEVCDEEASEVGLVFLTSEPLAEEPRLRPELEQELALKRLDQRQKAPKKGPAGPANDDGAPAQDPADDVAELEAYLKEAGAPSELLASVAGAADLDDAFDRMMNQVDPDPDKAANLVEEAKGRMQALLIEHGEDPSVLDDDDQETPGWTADRVEAAARAGETMAGLDLRGLDLSGRDLSGAQLGEAQLQGANLGHAMLERADLRNALLVGADLTEATCGNAILAGADLTAVTAPGVALWGADLSGAVIEDAQLAGARLDHCQAAGASFRRSDLSGAKLAEADLTKARMDETIVHEADFRSATLMSASLAGARGEEVCFASANLFKLRAGRGASFYRADLREARAGQSIWMGAALKEARLTLGTFVRADLSRADLEGAKLDGCDCRDADLTKSRLSGASLLGTNFTAACLQDADLRDADARKAVFYEAELWRAETKGLALAEAQLSMSKLAPRETP